MNAKKIPIHDRQDWIAYEVQCENCTYEWVTEMRKNTRVMSNQPPRTVIQVVCPHCRTQGEVRDG